MNRGSVLATCVVLTAAQVALGAALVTSTGDRLDCLTRVGDYRPGERGTLAICERDGLTVAMYPRP